MPVSLPPRAACLYHDCIPAVDRFGLVARHLHGRTARHSRSLQIPHRTAAEVMNQFPRQASKTASFGPLVPLALDGCTVGMDEDPRDGLAGAALQLPHVFVLPFQNRPQLRRRREPARSLVLLSPGSSRSHPVLRSMCRLVITGYRRLRAAKILKTSVVNRKGFRRGL